MNAQDEADGADAKLPNWLLSLVPLLVIIFLNIVKIQPIYALGIGILAIMLLNWKERKKFIPAINAGGAGSVVAVLNTSAAVGFGAVIVVVPAFGDYRFSVQFVQQPAGR